MIVLMHNNPVPLGVAQLPLGVRIAVQIGEQRLRSYN